MQGPTSVVTAKIGVANANVVLALVSGFGVIITLAVTEFPQQVHGEQPVMLQLGRVRIWSSGLSIPPR